MNPGSEPIVLNDPARLAALRRLSLSDAAMRDALDRLARLAARFLDAPAAAVSVVEENRVSLPGSHGLPDLTAGTGEVPITSSYCRYVVEEGTPLAVEDAREHPLFRSHPALLELGIVSYLGIPLATSDGHVLGAFCVFGTEPRRWTADQVELLRDLSASVMTEIELRLELRERTAAQEARAHVEAHYRRLVTSVPEAVYVLDAAGRFTELNPAAERILERTCHELIGAHYSTVLNAQSQPEARRVFDAVISGAADDVALQLRILRPSGEERLLSLTVTAVREEVGIVGVHGIARDVTDARAAELALRESEERFRQITENVREIFWIFTPDFSRAIYLSPAYERATGYPVASVEQNARSFLEPVHPEDLADLLAAMERIRSEAIVEGIEFRFRHSDGSLRWFRARGYPVRDDEGNVYRVVGTSEDITARKEAELAAREGHERLRLASLATHDVIWDWTLADDRCVWNDNLERLFGYPAAAVEPDVRWWRARIHPDDTPRVVQGLQTALEDRLDFWSDEYRFRDANGSYVHVLDRGHVARDADGRPVRMVGSMLDLSERIRSEAALRESEAKFRQVVGAIPQVIWMYDPGFTETQYLSPAFERIWGLPLETGYRDPRCFLACIHPDDRPAILRAITELDESPARLPEYRISRPDGVERWLRTRGFLARDEQGVVRRVVGITEDITERKRLEEQFQQAQKMEAVGRLAGGVAHDFNNQLTAILGFAGFLKLEIPPDPELEMYVSEIHKAAERSAKLTHQLLAFSRRQILQPSVLDLNDVVRGVDLLLRRLVGTDVELVTVPGTAAGRIKADRSQMEQVLVNFVVNARDALLDGGRIVIQTMQRRVESPLVRFPDTIPRGDYAVLAVSDDGCGMDPDTLEQIFDPFFTTKEQGKGTGLGLSMVLGTVKQSGGYIAVYSEVGAGTTFKIFLPRIEAPAPGGDGPAKEKAAAGRGVVLVAEDEPAVRSLIRSALRKAGYAVLEAENGEEALRIWSENRERIDLVLTDLTMPLLGGRELGRRLRLERPDLPIVYVSGYTDGFGDEGDSVRDAFLTKPFLPEELLERVARLAPPV